MILFPNCKINLGLNIIRKRKDGYHDLETVFYPVKLFDILEIIPSTLNPQPSTLNFTASGLYIHGEAENNLCVKAYHILKKDIPSLPSIQMHLHKAIPMGAGLGGGSADGACTLKLLNKIFNLSLSTDQLIHYSLQLGSDCPFFILDEPSFATGRGEILEKISIDLSAYQLVIVNPGIHLATGWSFAQVKPHQPQKSIAAIIRQPVETWKDELTNDFEMPVINHYPEIGHIKNTLYQQGAVYAGMTGSGSSVFGLFGKKAPLSFSFPEGYFVKTV